MCRYGFRLPKVLKMIYKLIKKATHLLVSDDDMSVLAKECPGSQHPKHLCHQPVAGSCKGVGKISTHAGRYTPAFVRAVFETVPSFREVSQNQCVECLPWTSQHEQEDLVVKDALSKEASDEDSKKAVDLLHRNLSHPPTHDMARILKHGRASDKALEFARKHTCGFCRSHVRPHVPLPSKSSRVTEFNEVVSARH